MTNGSIDYKEWESAIQRVFGDKLDEGRAHSDHPGTPRKWRSATYWDEDCPQDLIDDDQSMTFGEAIEDEDIFEDLIAMTDDGEPQFIFMQEMPVMMGESEAVELVSENLEEIFYETHRRCTTKEKEKARRAKARAKVALLAPMDLKVYFSFRFLKNRFFLFKFCENTKT